MVDMSAIAEIEFPQGEVPQHPDHFMLGISWQGFAVLCYQFEFFTGFGREGNAHSAKCFDRPEELSWVSTQEPCGYDLQFRIAQLLKAQNLHRVSICEAMHHRGHPEVGPANRFLSHAQSEELRTTVAAMQFHEGMALTAAACGREGSKPRFFLDYVCIRQAQRGDFTFDEIKSAIARINNTVVLLSPTKAPIVRTRIFCLFELAASLEKHVFLQATLDPGELHDLPWNQYSEEWIEHIAQQVNFAVDVKAAQIRRGQEHDRDAICEYFESQPGGIAEAEIKLSESLRTNFIDQLKMYCKMAMS